MPSKGRTIPINITQVIDGDSLRCRRSGIRSLISREFEIRMYGIDAPEYRQEMGTESRHALMQHLNGGQLMAEITDIDRYGRHIALIYHKRRGREDSVNLAMVHTGWAHWYSQYGGRELGFDQAQKHAQANSLGVWQRKTVQRPWDYRKQQRKQQDKTAVVKWLVILTILGAAALAVAKVIGLL